jgi:hypothetical protein
MPAMAFPTAMVTQGTAVEIEPEHH